jgi:hypothetical protein
MQDIDLWRAAALVLKEHGTNASNYAMQRALDLKEEGDANGEAAWLRIFDAIWELQRSQRRAAERQH